ncbi:MAG: hypothetical protein WED34_00185 [Planctomycetales bacterium]
MATIGPFAFLTAPETWLIFNVCLGGVQPAGSVQHFGNAPGATAVPQSFERPLKQQSAN